MAGLPTLSYRIVAACRLVLACRSFRCPERQALGRRSASPDEYDELEVRGALALRGTRQPEASPGGYRFYVARQPLRCRSGSKSVAVRNSAKHQRASFRPKADSLLSHSITYRIALGPRAGQKAFTLRSLPGNPLPAPSKPFLASADGFSLHAGVAAGADDRKNVERLCRYIARPAIATGRLSLTTQGQVRYTLKTPYRDGTTHVVFEPLDFIARLAALVPKPRAPDTRRPHAGRAAPGDELGAAAEAGVRH